MTTRTWYPILTTLLAAILLIACQSLPAGRSAEPAAAIEPIPDLPNLLILSAGLVEVRRVNSLTFVPVPLGAEVQPGDVLRLSEGEAALFCGAESSWPRNPLMLAAGKNTGVPCSAGRPPRPDPDAAAVRSRGGEELTTANEIYILSPRSGNVLNDRPTLIWHELATAASYTVTLESDDGVMRTFVADDSPLPYPDTWEPLQAEGASYRLIVATGDKTSGDETPGFSLLEDQVSFRDKVNRLRQRPLEEPALTLLLAELYLSHRLRSEAVELLTALPDADETIAVQGLLGETYLNMGLVTEAKAAYTRMLELAQGQGFVEAHAQALTGLGFAACALRDHAAVTEYWSQANALYDQYGLATQGTPVSALLDDADKHCS